MAMECDSAHEKLVAPVLQSSETFRCSYSLLNLKPPSHLAQDFGFPSGRSNSGRHNHVQEVAVQLELMASSGASGASGSVQTYPFICGDRGDQQVKSDSGYTVRSSRDDMQKWCGRDSDGESAQDENAHNQIASASPPP